LSIDDEEDNLVFDGIVKDPDDHSTAQVNATKAVKDFTSKSSQFSRSTLKKLDDGENGKMQNGNN